LHYLFLFSLRAQPANDDFLLYHFPLRIQLAPHSSIRAIGGFHPAGAQLIDRPFDRRPTIRAAHGEAAFQQPPEASTAHMIRDFPGHEFTHIHPTPALAGRIG